MIAEEVAKVNQDLVIYDSDAKPYTVRYDAVNAMLLNEFLKEHTAFVEKQRKVQEQGATIARLEQQIEALTAGLQKVNVKLELTKSAPQTVVNNQITLNPEVQTLFAGALQLLTVDGTRISGLRSLVIPNVDAIPLRPKTTRLFAVHQTGEQKEARLRETG